MEKNCKNWGFPANDHITHIFNPYWAIFTLLPSMCVKLQKLELSSVIACRVSIFGLDFLLGIAWGPFFLIWVSFLSIFLQLKLWFQQSLFFHEVGRNIAVCVVLFLMFLYSLFLGFDENGRSFHICCWWCLLKLCIWLLLCERQKKGALESSCHVKPSQWTRKCFCWLAFRKFYKAFRQQQQQQKHSGSKKHRLMMMSKLINLFIVLL